MAVPPLSHLDNPVVARSRPRRRRALYLLPVAGFIGLVAAFAASLRQDPSLVPSPLIGKPIPNFDLPPVAANGRGLSSRDLLGRVSLVNVFASWCVSCREEHPLLVRLAELKSVPIAGLDYEDKPADALRWLRVMGNPYTRIGADMSGRVAIDWGVYGVPETFLVDRRGIIAYKRIGPLTPDILEGRIAPLVARLREMPAADNAGR